MHNPFLLNNLISQGFRYILFSSPEEKMLYTEDEASHAVTKLKSFSSAKQIIAEQSNHNKINVKPTTGQSQHVVSSNEQSSYLQSSPLLPKTSSLKNTEYSQKESNKQQSTPFIKNAIQGLQEKNPLPEPILPVSEWPDIWKQIQKRCQLPTQRPQNLSKQIVWTYFGLEYDLFTKSPSDKRRQLITQIIKTLSFPKGTHLFLPYRHINEQGASTITQFHVTNTTYSFFWSAIDLIRPRILIVFGEKCIEELKLPPLLPTQKHTLMPVIVYALDDIMLYTDSEIENNIMMTFLKSNLKAFA